MSVKPDPRFYQRGTRPNLSESEFSEFKDDQNSENLIILRILIQTIITLLLPPQQIQHKRILQSR